MAISSRASDPDDQVHTPATARRSQVSVLITLAGIRMAAPARNRRMRASREAMADAMRSVAMLAAHSPVRLVTGQRRGVAASNAAVSAVIGDRAIRVVASGD